MAKVASKQKRILDIVSMLEQGMERKQILQKVAKTCKVSARTLDNEIKEAKEVLAERNKQKEAIRQAQTSETLKEAVNEAILSDLQIEAILCNVIAGEYQVEEIVRGGVVLRDVSPMEIVAAAKTIYAKRGSNAPARVDHRLEVQPVMNIDPLSDAANDSA